MLTHCRDDIELNIDNEFQRMEVVMASFKDEYSYRTISPSVRHDVCITETNTKCLTEDQDEYARKLVDLMLDELIKSPGAFTA